MKRIGILTFHRAHNYGAVLQAFALQQFLISLGLEVQFIDYKNKKLLEVYDLVNLRRVLSKNPIKLSKRLLKEITSFKSRLKRNQGFNTFISERLNIESNIAFEYINTHFDVVFIGSDQVWNFHLTNGFDSYYWGSFKNKESKLILASYAASMEVSQLSETEELQVGKLLKNFDTISVREDSLKESLSRLSEKKFTVVADPTLLVDRSVWDNIATKNKRDKPYLLLYQVRNCEKNIALAKQIAATLNLEIAYLSARLDAINSPDCVGASPADYLSLFKHASFVLCSSFHGTVFSVLFQVPFFAILMGDGKDSRNIAILNSLGLQERGIKYNDKIIYQPIEWITVNTKLEKIREYSAGFLKEIIS